MVNPQGENREPIDRAAERLGVLRRVIRSGDAAAAQLLGDPIVELFDPIVPLLVELVDGPLDLGHFRVGGRRRAGFVFLVPKAKVITELLANNPQETIVRIVNGLLVPSGNAIAVQVRYGFKGNHRARSVDTQCKTVHLATSCLGAVALTVLGSQYRVQSTNM